MEALSKEDTKRGVSRVVPFRQVVQEKHFMRANILES